MNLHFSFRLCESMSFLAMTVRPDLARSSRQSRRGEASVEKTNLLVHPDIP